MSHDIEQYMRYMFDRGSVRGIPMAGTFELTARCNLNCRMCYIHRSEFDAGAVSGELSADWWKRTADMAAEQGMLSLLITGGEPLLRRDFREIYSHCRQLGVLVSVNSNGTLLTPEYAGFFAENPPQRLNITLYGASEATYAALCGDGGAYRRAVGGIEALLAAKVPVKINYSATPYNADDLPAVMAFAKERDLPVQLASYMFPPVRVCGGGALSERLTPEKAAAVQLSYDRLRFRPEEYEKRRTSLLSGVPYVDPEEECLDTPTERIRCRAGRTCFWVTWDGQMRPCGMMTVPTTGMEAGFVPAWESTRSAREAIVIPAKCALCKARNYCGACPSASYGETGSFDGVPEYLCRKTNAYMELLRAEEAGKV